MRLRLTSLVLVALIVSAVLGLPRGAEAAPKTLNFNVVPLTISNITVENGQLVAHGRAGSQPFTTPVNLALAQVEVQPQQAGACPILNLELGPIHLNLLGLVVDTSEICLDITAHEGGGLLGDLLCLVANLLNGEPPLPLGTILTTNLTPTQLNQLTSGLTTLLNEVLARITAASAVAQASCDILNLALGPIDLNLLGLQVELDDCAGGPVTVDVTAEPGALLGDLLCGLSGILDNTGAAPVASSARLLQTISAEIARMLQ
jgi:hypothetical protein